MKSLETYYYSFITEMARPKGSKNKPKDPTQLKTKKDVEDYVKDAEYAKNVDPKHVKPTGPKMPVGKSAEDSNKVHFDCDSPDPKWEEEYAKMNVDELNDADYFLSYCFDKKKDFFVLGEAGWAKTASIKAMALKHGYHVITVYLDKAEPTDLHGQNVPTKDERTGEVYVEHTMPDWVRYMYHNQDKKFLLFFDEMNQAPADVQNALMPIVLEHVVCQMRFNNFMCGAAGNFSWENDVDELSIPLKSRFQKFTWPSHTADAWDAAFDWMHKTYDSKVGKEAIDKIRDFQNYLKSPRDITRYIIEGLLEQSLSSASAQKKYSRTFIVKNTIENEVVWRDEDGKVKGGEDRIYTNKLNALCDYLTNYIKNGGAPEETGNSRSRSKGMDNVNADDKKALIIGLKQGYVYFSEEEGGNNEKYLCTVENCITDIFDPAVTGITAEVLRKILRDMEAAGDTPKYQTNADGKKDAEKFGWHYDSDDYASDESHFLLADHIKDAFDVVPPKRKQAVRRRKEE